MNRKVMIIIIVLFIILACIILIKPFDKKNTLKEIPTYKSNLVCTNDNSKIYIYYDDNKNINKTIYQITNEYDESSSYKLIKDIHKIYNKIDGIEASFNVINNKTLEEIKYDYSKIDLINAKKVLSDISNDNLLLKKINSLPINYVDYKILELDGYDCI